MCATRLEGGVAPARAQVSGETIVDELVARDPRTARVFLRRRMACVGCPIARFETVEAVCAIYRQPLDAVLAELREAARADTDRGA